MATKFSTIVNYTTGSTLKCYLRKWDTETSSAGYWYNDTTDLWVASDPGSAAYFSMAEVGSTGTYIYGTSTALETYTGTAIAFYYVGGSTLGVSQEVYFASGAQIKNESTLSAVVTDTNELQVDWVNGGRLDLLLDLATTGGVAADPVSANVVSAARTWVLASHADAVTARNIVTIGAASVCTLAMDFRDVLNGSSGGPNTSISTVASATDTDGIPTITFTSVLVAQDRRCAHFTISSGALVTAGTVHTIKVGITTTDTQTLYGYGLLKVI